jgi:hypothetical protein
MEPTNQREASEQLPKLSQVIQIVAPRHARHRRARLQGLFHDLASLFHAPSPFLPSV